MQEGACLQQGRRQHRCQRYAGCDAQDAAIGIQDGDGIQPGVLHFLLQQELLVLRRRPGQGSSTDRAEPMIQDLLQPFKAAQMHRRHVSQILHHPGFNPVAIQIEVARRNGALDQQHQQQQVPSGRQTGEARAHEGSQTHSRNSHITIP
ncbi:hypothetical protein D3C80_1202160 [compost metagenome]